MPFNGYHAASSIPNHYDSYPFTASEAHRGQLKGKIALVTGAGRGIGKATALALGAAGAKVVCIARRQDDIDQVAAPISVGSSDHGLAVAADISDGASAGRVLEATKKQWGSDAAIDILVCAAGMTRVNTFVNEKADLADWWHVMQVNLFGTVSFVRAVLPDMLSRNQGTIIMMTSTSGSLDMPYMTSYSTSKAAVIKYTQDLSVELLNSKVACVSLHPGCVGQTDLASVKGAINMDVVQGKQTGTGESDEGKKGNAEGMQMQMRDPQDHAHVSPPELPANTVVALCVDGNARALHGKYVDVEQDLGVVLDDAKKGWEGRIAKDNLYWLKMEEL